jgi:DNA-binding NtrC family response regulator
LEGTLSTVTPPEFQGILGKSKAMREIWAFIEKVAASDISVCIHGAPGTGKDLVARAIHDRSYRRNQPFLTFDCSSVPAELVESYLFGDVRPAVTRSLEESHSLFVRAHSGTLLLHELRALNPDTQAKLTRVLRTREFYEVGGTRALRCDIRLITTMTRDPKHEVEKGLLSEELYYRVAAFLIGMPPLSEWADKGIAEGLQAFCIPALADHVVRWIWQTSGVEGTRLARKVPAEMDGVCRSQRR